MKKGAISPTAESQFPRRAYNECPLEIILLQKPFALAFLKRLFTLAGRSYRSAKETRKCPKSFVPIRLFLSGLDTKQDTIQLYLNCGHNSAS